MATMKPTGGAPVKFQRSGPIIAKDTLGQGIKGSWPTVWAYMSTDAWEDGSPRQVATLLIVLDPDGLKGCINDRAETRSLWVTGTDMDDVMSSLEKQLCSPNPGWRYHRKM